MKLKTKGQKIAFVGTLHQEMTRVTFSHLNWACWHMKSLELPSDLSEGRGLFSLTIRLWPDVSYQLLLNKTPLKENFICQLQGCRKLGVAQAAVKMLAGLQSCEDSVREDPITNLLSVLLLGFSFSWTPSWRPLQVFATLPFPCGRVNMAAGFSQTKKKSQRTQERGMGFFV